METECCRDGEEGLGGERGDHEGLAVIGEEFMAVVVGVSEVEYDGLVTHVIHGEAEVFQPDELIHGGTVCQH